MRIDLSCMIGDITRVFNEVRWEALFEDGAL